MTVLGQMSDDLFKGERKPWRARGNYILRKILRVPLHKRNLFHNYSLCFFLLTSMGEGERNEIWYNGSIPKTG